MKSGPAFYLLGPAQPLVNSGFHEGEYKVREDYFPTLAGFKQASSSTSTL